MPRALGIEPFYQALGKRIATYRTRLHLSQAALGNLLKPKLTRASIANVEWGKQRVLAHTIVELAQALRVPVSALYAGTGEDVSADQTQEAPPVSEQILEEDIMAAAKQISKADARRLASAVYSFTRKT